MQSHVTFSIYLVLLLSTYYTHTYLGMYRATPINIQYKHQNNIIIIDASSTINPFLIKWKKEGKWGKGKRGLYLMKRNHITIGALKRTIHSSTFIMIREKSLFLHFTNKYVVIFKKSNLDLCSYFKINTNNELLLLGNL